ncbi:MAG: GNAT family N-acetyltransferase [Candidatus Cryptobacteroides sp.]
MSESVTISTKRFNDLSLEELYGILRVRSEVFVTGQKCLYVDPDGKDLDSVQVFASDGGRITGCLRIYQKEAGVLQIGRVAVIESRRGKGLGLQMMQQAIAYVRENCPEGKIYLEAQTYAIGFYEKLGFKVVSDEFLDEGIPHKGMELIIDREYGIQPMADAGKAKRDRWRR